MFWGTSKCAASENSLVLKILDYKASSDPSGHTWGDLRWTLSQVYAESFISVFEIASM